MMSCILLHKSTLYFFFFLFLQIQQQFSFAVHSHWPPHSGPYSAAALFVPRSWDITLPFADATSVRVVGNTLC